MERRDVEKVLRPIRVEYFGDTVAFRTQRYFLDPNTCVLLTFVPKTAFKDGGSDLLAQLPDSYGTKVKGRWKVIRIHARFL